MTAAVSVLVVGGGIAGTAAAFAAESAGARVQMIVGRTGATSLGSGALDGVWPPTFDLERRQPCEAPRLARLAPFVGALNLFELGPKESCVATLAGRLRCAAGRDRAVLDLASLARGRVLVPRVDRPEWDADALCRAYQEHGLASEMGLTFEPFNPPMLKRAHERALSIVDYASLLDDPDRIEWFLGALGERVNRADISGVLTGPWLGASTATIAALRRRLVKPIGETLSPPGGIAGVRFERARDRLLASRRIVMIEDWLSFLTKESKWVARTESGVAVEADSVVIATGGLLGGGIALGSLDAAPDLGTSATGAPGFTPGSLLVGVVGRHGKPLERTQSAFGLLGESVDLSTVQGRDAWRRTGLLCDDEWRLLDADRRPLGDLFGAGDMVADRSRCLLDAIETGLASGASAARNVYGRVAGD